MYRRIRFLVSLLAITIALAPLGAARAAHDGAQEQEPGQTATLGTTEIAVDVVVRDDKGKTVQNLTAADFKIVENGVPQEIASFRYVAKGETPPEPPVPAGAPPKPKSPFAGVSAVAFVFDRLTPDARVRAQRAANSFVTDGLGKGDIAGVFKVDLSMNIAQPFTTDLDAIHKAIDKVAGQSDSNFTSNAEIARDLSRRNEQLSGQLATSQASASAASGSQGAAGAGGDIGLQAVEQKVAEMTLRSIETFESLERDQEGYATTNGLLAVVSSLSQMPGRKAIIFFSEGLAIPPKILPFFRSVISNANRANVSVYTIDAAGLRAVSQQAETAKELAAAGASNLERVGSGSGGGGTPLMRGLERNEDLLRLDPETGLGELATGTGGVLIAGTNDPSARLRVVGEDLHSHYVLTYVPKDQGFDGQFRKISVEVARPKLSVQAREGYYAIDADPSVSILPYEARPVALLLGDKAKTTFPVRLRSLNFPEKDRPGLTDVLVQVPTREFSGTLADDKKTFATDFAIVAIVRDDAGRIVSKVSRRYELGGPADALAEFQKGDVLFFRETTLPPGDYTVEAIAYDASTEKSSMAKSRLSIPEPSDLRISSAVVVGRAEKVSAEAKQETSPLHFGDLLIYPNLGVPLSKAKDGKLPFFVTAYTAPGGAAPKMTIELVQNGKLLGKVPADLPAPDANGRIQFVNALPLDAFPPGTYELRLTVERGGASASSSVPFTVVP